MKNIIKSIFIILVLLIGVSSCEDYLDVRQEALTTTEEEIFGNFLEYQNYVSNIYQNSYLVWHGPTYGARNGGYKHAGFPLCASDQARRFTVDGEESWFNLSNFQNWFEHPTRTDHHHLQFWVWSWAGVRAANVCIDKIDLLQDATEAQKNGLLGQAYMGRAFAYEFILEIWGGMHYLTKPIEASDPFDMERLTPYETALNIAADCDTAATLLPARWDSGDPAAEDFLNTQETRRFTSVFAKALKARMLLYAASPLAQRDKPASATRSAQQDWEEAAKAAYEAIQHAESNGYHMLDFDNYSDNFYGSRMITEEHIYTTMHPKEGIGIVRDQCTSWEMGRSYYPYSISKHHNRYGHGIFATHDIAERFEAVKYDSGGNIVEAAPVTSAPVYYHAQDPFNADKSKGYGRDPRFYSSMIYHGRPIDNLKKPRPFNMQDGSEDLKQGDGYNNTTGYYTGKFWNLGVNKKLGNRKMTYNPWCIFRVPELYLILAEASNQAYGPTAATAGMSAEEALNTVRNRVGMPDITGLSKEEFNKRVLNERHVELCFESQISYVDSRRLMLADDPEFREVRKMNIVPNPGGVTEQYPTGYIFTPMVLETKYFGENSYFFPVPQEDVEKSVLFKQNPGY